MRRVDDVDTETRLVRPGNGSIAMQPEQPLHPLDIPLATSGAELRPQVDVPHGQAPRAGGLLDLRNAAQLARAHHLVLVEQEDGDAGGVEELVDLSARTLTQRLGRVAVDGLLPQTVRLVEDEHVQPVLLRGHEAVEVHEQALGPGRTLASHLAQGLRERPRPGRVQHGAPLPRQLAQQRQRDDALAAAGTTGHDDHRLGVRRPRLVDGRQHHLVGDALLVEEDELLALADLGGRDAEQLPRRADRRAEELVGGVDSRLRREQTPQQVVQLAAALAGDEPSGRRRRHHPQVLHPVVRRVVQVGHTGH